MFSQGFQHAAAHQRYMPGNIFGSRQFLAVKFEFQVSAADMLANQLGDSVKVVASVQIAYKDSFRFIQHGDDDGR